MHSCNIADSFLTPRERCCIRWWWSIPQFP